MAQDTEKAEIGLNGSPFCLLASSAEIPLASEEAKLGKYSVDEDDISATVFGHKLHPCHCPRFLPGPGRPLPSAPAYFPGSYHLQGSGAPYPDLVCESGGDVPGQGDRRGLYSKVSSQMVRKDHVRPLAVRFQQSDVLFNSTERQRVAN